MRIAVIATAVCLSIGGLSAVCEAQAVVKQQIDIPAQALGPALQTLAKHHNLQIIYVSEEVGSLRTAGAAGELTVDEALKKLLSGTGLIYRYLDDKTITVQPAAGGDSPPAGFRPAADVTQGPRGEVGASSGAADSARNTAPTDALTEVIVTAQKFAEPLSKAPITVSAITADDLVARHLNSIQDFDGAVPGLQVNYYSGRPTTNIRGVGQTILNATSNSQIAFNVNGVYLGNSTGAGASFLDIDRIEVLRGPQGTLYGRNATGGAINIVTAKPTREFLGYADVAYGNYDDVGATLVASGPLSEALSARVAVASGQRDGYSHNLYDGKDYDDADWQAIRATLQYDFASNASLTVIGDYYTQDDGSNATHFFGFGTPSHILPGVAGGGSSIPVDANGQAIDPDLLNINTLPAFKVENIGVAADLDWQISDQLSFKSLSAYRYVRNSYTGDFDLSTYPSPGFYNVNKNPQISQEFQLIGDMQPFKWVAGLYYYHRTWDPISSKIPLNFGAVNFPFYVQLNLAGVEKATSYAAFGQVTWALTEKFSATAGLRYSYERHTGSTYGSLFGGDFGAVGPAVNFDDISPKLTLDYQATDRLMVYATVSKGFQAGGYAVIQNPPLLAYDPEVLWDYEAGVKYRNRWLSMDFAAFHYDYKDLQVSKIVDGFTKTTNAAKSRLNGAELETTVRPFSHFEVRAAFAYLDAEYSEFQQEDVITGGIVDLGGNQMAGGAKNSSNVYAVYDIDLGEHKVWLSGEWNYRSRVYFTELNYASVSQAPLHTLNAAVRFGPWTEKWYLEVYGKNLGDKDFAVYKFLNSEEDGFPVIGHLGAPRTYGVKLHYQFGE